MNTRTASLWRCWKWGLLAILACCIGGCVVGGTPVAEGENPWQAALIASDSTPLEGVFCSGTLIAKNWVLTAAHCFMSKDCVQDKNVASFMVRYGGVNLGEHDKYAGVKALYINPDYTCTAKSSDIALVELTDPVQVSSFIPLATSTDMKTASAGSPFIYVSGWGFKEGRRTSRSLMEANVPLVPMEICNGKKMYNGKVAPQCMCAGQTGRDACTGDSGGPLYERVGHKVLQVGIVSYGKGCGENLPSVYTQVSAFRPWIIVTTQNAP